MKKNLNQILFAGILTTLLLTGIAMTVYACDNHYKETVGLIAYKKDANVKLTAYVEALNSDHYSDENWAVIEEIINMGKKILMRPQT